MTNSKTVSSKLTYSGSPRHLLVFLDGTWNDENGKANDGVTTTIYKLFRALEGDLTETNIPHTIKHEKHIALYFRGIGNDDDNSMIGSWFFGAFGGSEKRIRDHAFVSIIEHYRAGDKISIFGFSRGSATARLLASNLEKKGIPASVRVHSKNQKNSSTGVTEAVYKEYSNLSKKKEDKVQVQFLGILDTVGAFGIPIDFGFGSQKINLFKDLTVSQNVKQVVHCVSIDESREPFIPTLCNRATNVDELWFAGVHADIGGGYLQSNLSRIPLNYMVSKLTEVFTDDPIEFNELRLMKLIEYDLDDEFHLHHHGDGFIKARRAIIVLSNGEESKFPPKIHVSVLKIMESKKLYLATPFDSFTTIERIQYFPKSVNGLLGKYKIIEE
ncbi:DUF2235 domain-containing protein [Psychromonas sp. SA13A]|uniref:phospholipase effector Tle1 domain-containing protein n=1 Tax=Psychromonas sp. SA13A TaxID=2686346 RepID=UPI00140B28F6|nr:DUF2235 domain-containing protein [Psychromonas sp. SA13A]